MQRSPIFYPKGAGFDGAMLRALHAAIVNVGRLVILAAVLLTITSWSFDWILDLAFWGYWAALVAAFWCIAVLYEWRCRRRRLRRTRGYRLELQNTVLEQKRQG